MLNFIRQYNYFSNNLVLKLKELWNMNHMFWNPDDDSITQFKQK